MTVNEHGLQVVPDGMWERAQLEQLRRETYLTFLQLGIAAFDAVLDSLPESSRACLWLADAIKLAERVKEALD